MESSVNFNPEEYPSVLIDRGDTGETPWKHARHNHDMYRHVSLGAAAPSFCGNYAAVHLYSGGSLCVNEQRQRIGERPLRC